MHSAQFTVETLLEKFEITLDIPIFILKYNIQGNYTKMEKKFDKEDVDFYYEFTSENQVLRLTSSGKNGRMEEWYLCPKRGLIFDFIYKVLKKRRFAGGFIWNYDGSTRNIDCICF